MGGRINWHHQIVDSALGNRQINEWSIAVSTFIITQTIVANLKSSRHSLTKLIGYSIAWIGSLCLSIGWEFTALAQQKADPTLPDLCEVDLGLLKSDSKSIPAHITTADTVSLIKMTMPSLWWASEQSPPNLISNWVADRTQNQVYLVVNPQYWNILDYVDRYAFVDRFGRVSRGYGYNLRLCTDRKIVLAEYQCDKIANSTSCRILMNAAGQAASKIQN
jgi:hypothetical protein